MTGAAGAHLRVRAGAVLLGAVLVCGCGARSATEPDESSAATDASSTSTAHEDVRSYSSYGESYEDVHGDADCTDDCSGHDAGYQWAEDNDVTDESDCDGNSDSFNEGCQAYVEDNSDGADDENDDNGGDE